MHYFYFDPSAIETVQLLLYSAAGSGAYLLVMSISILAALYSVNQFVFILSEHTQLNKTLLHIMYDISSWLSRVLVLEHTAYCLLINVRMIILT